MKLSCAKGLKKRRLLYAAAFCVLLLILVLAHHILYQNKGFDRGEMSAPTDMFASENSSEPTEASHEMIQAWDGNVSRLQKINGPYSTGVVSVLALVDDEVYCYNVENTATIFAYNLQSGERTILGQIDGLSLGLAQPVLLDGKIYFTVNKRTENSDMGNTLIAIDCQEKRASECVSIKASDPFMHIALWGDQLLLLTRDELEDGYVSEFFSYNPSTGMVSEELTEKISKDGMTGRIIWCFCAAGNFLYTLEQSGSADAPRFFLVKRDTDYIQLAEYEIESKDLPARPGEMFCVDENHYGLRTFDADLRILEINANKGAEAIQLLEETGTTSDLQATIPTLYSKKSIYYRNADSAPLYSELPLQVPEDEEIYRIRSWKDTFLIESVSSNTTLYNTIHSWYLLAPSTSD